MKIKTFEFLVSDTNCTQKQNASRNTDLEKLLNQGGVYDDEYSMSRTFKESATPTEIDKTINTFIKDKNIINITPITYTINQHNNGGFDRVIIRYTIIYE